MRYLSCLISSLFCISQMECSGYGTCIGRYIGIRVCNKLLHPPPRKCSKNFYCGQNFRIILFNGILNTNMHPWSNIACFRQATTHNFIFLLKQQCFMQTVPWFGRAAVFGNEIWDLNPIHTSQVWDGFWSLFLETHASFNNIFFVWLWNLGRFLVHCTGIWMGLKATSV